MREYKGCTGLMQVDPDAGIIFGQVIGLRDVITFQGETVAEATKAFHDSVDDYLAWCAQKGDVPERPFSGKFVLRTGPDLHRRLAVAAEVRGQSLNALVLEVLKERFSDDAELQPPKRKGRGEAKPAQSRSKNPPRGKR